MRHGSTTPVAQRDHTWAILVGAIFLQMLPATLVAPAVRPFVAERHGGIEGVMHAFMAVNMLGAILAAPVVGMLADRLPRPRRLVAYLAAADAILIGIIPHLPTGAMLAARAAEGAVHVGAATVLLSELSAWGRRRGNGRIMGAGGAAIMFAVASGHGVGGALLTLHPTAPFTAGAIIAAGVAIWAALTAARGESSLPGQRNLPPWHRVVFGRDGLLVPVTAAFVGRFTVGCVVVTFALFARTAHGTSDSAIGGLFALLTFVFAFGMYPAGRACDRWPPALLLGAGALGYACCLTGLVHVSATGLPWLMALAGLASALIFAPTLCYATSLTDGATRARAMSLINAAGCLGMLLGPAAAGILSAVLRDPGDPLAAYRAVFYLASASVLTWLGASAVWLAARTRREWAAARPVPTTAATR